MVVPYAMLVGSVPLFYTIKAGIVVPGLPPCSRPSAPEAVRRFARVVADGAPNARGVDAAVRATLFSVLMNGLFLVIASAPATGTH